MIEGSHSELDRRNDKRRRAWAKRASTYDKSIGFFERRIFGRGHRPWACSRASGAVLEVAVGTGLNFEHYPPGANVTGLDLSREMVEVARKRAAELGRTVDLRVGDAHHLPFDDGSFDTVLCTYSLCNIPDTQVALAEMGRVLRPGGNLILVDHIRSKSNLVLGFQKLIEFFSRRIEGEYMTRRPAEHLEGVGLEIEEQDRLGPTGIIERVIARKPR